MTEQGKAPKSAKAIRSKLETISQTANVVRQKGPINNENQADRQIVVASFFDHQLGRQFQQELNRHGLFSQSTVRERKLVISVDYPDAKLAGSLSQKFRNQFPDHRPARDSSRFDYMIFGGAIGLAIGVVFIVGAKNEMVGIGFALATFGIGAAGGHILDRIRMSSIRNGRFVLGLWEFLVVVGILGMVIAATQGFPLLLK